jgi:hypothetical protein
MDYKGRIKKVYQDTARLSYITSGIGKADQPRWDNSFHGSNGTYCTGSTVYRFLFINVAVYDLEVKGENTTIQIDIRDIALKIFKRKKVTDKFIEMLQSKLTGKKIKIIQKDLDYFADEDEIANILN